MTSEPLRVSNALYDYTRGNLGHPPYLTLNQRYKGINFTNVDLSNADVCHGVHFDQPANSGVLDLGYPWQYRFLIVHFTKQGRRDGIKQRRENDYMVKSGCKWLTRDEAYAYWGQKPRPVQWGMKVPSWNREGVVDLLRVADIRANLYWDCRFKAMK